MEKLLNFFMESCNLNAEQSKRAMKITTFPNRSKVTMDLSTFLLLSDVNLTFSHAHAMSMEALDIYNAETRTLVSSEEALDSGSAKLSLLEVDGQQTSTEALDSGSTKLSLLEDGQQTSTGSSNLAHLSFYYQDVGKQASGSLVDDDAFPVQADAKVTECLWPLGPWMKELNKTKEVVQGKTLYMSAESAFIQQLLWQEKRCYPKSVKSTFIKPTGDLWEPKVPVFFLANRNTEKLTHEAVGAILFTQSTSLSRNYGDTVIIGEAIAVGLKFLFHAPKNRSFVFVGITNLEAIRWYKVCRSDDACPYVRSAETACVRESLAGFMCSCFEKLGLHSGVVKVGKAFYPLGNWLGEGHTSHVYSVCVNSEDYAVKVPKSKMNVSTDIEYLTKLHGIKGIPAINSALSRPEAMFIQPLCFKFTKERFLRINYQACLGELIDTLKSAHDMLVVNRDIRLENVMIGADGHFVIVDWGFGAPLGEPVCYSGTTYFASGRVLRILEEGKVVFPSEASDDLISLVQSLLLFTRFNPAMQNKLYALGKQNYAGIRRFWEEILVDDWSRKLVAVASNRSYPELKECIQSWAKGL